jgi:hypothetical protein
MPTKVLFILKRREDYNPVAHSPLGLSTGLFNSALFVKDMLNDIGIEAEMEVAIDNNCIDRLINKHRPTHVVIEALWVVPSKFTVLTRLHPTVKWIVRLHSEMPFMAGEGIAMDWIGEYIKFPQISIGVNAPRMLEEVRTFLGTATKFEHDHLVERVFYLPNFYPQEYKQKTNTGNRYLGEKHYIDVSCFGAVRLLKNHMIQAIAAIQYANSQGKQLRFHINAGREEMQGSPVVHNLRSMFEHLADHGHQLIFHQWAVREDFLKICAQMDVGLQCNFSETFNIVSADLVSQGVPVVGSYEIPWTTSLFNARPAETTEIRQAMARALRYPRLNVWLNQRGLTKYTNKTRQIWSNYFKETTHA